MSFGKSIMRAANIALLWTKANADTIMLVGGMASVGVGTGLLIKNADKIAEVKERAREDKEELKEVDADEAGWSEMDETRKHFILRTTKEHAIGYIKAAGPGVAFIAAGEVLQGLSHATLARRYQAVNTALAGTAAAFSNYRERVRKDQGPEKDYEYLTGGSVVTVEMEKDGTVTTKEVPVHKIGDAQKVYIPHSFWIKDKKDFFDHYSDNGNINLAIDDIRRSISWSNEKLQADGYIFENQIREYCQLPKTMAGQSAGVFASDDSIANPVRIDCVDVKTGISVFDDAIYDVSDDDDYDILFEFVVTKYDPVDRHEIHEPLDANILTRMDMTELVPDPMNPLKKIEVPKFGWTKA